MEEAKYASGRWQVKEGKADEFIKRWHDWLEASTRSAPGFRSARLLQAEGDPLRFTSISDWDDDGSVKAWKTSPEFQQGIQATKALCDEFIGDDYDVVAAVFSPANQPS